MQRAAIRSTAVRSAEAAVREARAQVRRHGKICRTCSRRTAAKAQWCDEGWKLQMAVAAALHRLRTVKDAEQLQGQLW